jgi:D-alanine-D-alanine ligase-like ATP-grasp enzyme
MKKVAILFGGPSSEHEVSLSSAKNILEHINRDLFDVLSVLITKECQYVIDGISFSETDGMEEFKKRNIDIVFPVLHGMYGEKNSAFLLFSLRQMLQHSLLIKIKQMKSCI